MEKESTKVIAFYLPQFHTIPENDEWWGKGFTEWTNVRRATPLYWGHYQPRKPLKDNYYDLSDGRVMERQMKMAKKYGIDGFCFYHYWFHGKRLLEKPVENLLKNKKADLPFCMCWANESWSRTWDGHEGEKEVLVAQKYGDEKDWEEHFSYLLPFFKDDRYIKCEGKPVFLFYSAKDIEKCREMIALWNEMAIREGFEGIYSVEVVRNIKRADRNIRFDACVDFEPFATLNGRKPVKVWGEWCRKVPGLRRRAYPIIDYRKFTQSMIERSQKNRKNHFAGMFVGWDNTARMGENVRLLFENNAPSVFKERFRAVYENSVQKKREFLFINAWNEWAEGTYLEPDAKYGYGYLKAIREVKG